MELNASAQPNVVERCVRLFGRVWLSQSLAVVLNPGMGCEDAAGLVHPYSQFVIEVVMPQQPA
jgi:hypothetical protein